VEFLAVRDRAQAQALSRSPGSSLARVPPWGLLLFGIASIQIGAALATTIFDELGPNGATLVRMFFAAAVLLTLARPPVRSLSQRDLGLAAGLGLTLGAMNFFFYQSLDRIPLGVAVTVEFIGPLGVAVAGSRRAVDALWVGFAGAGILLLSPGTGGESVSTLGLLFAAVAGGFWALYILVNARVAHAFSGAQGLGIAMVVATALVAVPGVIQGGSELLDPGVLAIGAAVSVLSSALPYTLETEALRRLRPSVFGVLMSLEPAVAALAGFVILGQDLHARQIAAIVMVVVASVGALRDPGAPPPVEA
jgi:inner membrane transporter RhtA